MPQWAYVAIAAVCFIVALTGGLLLLKEAIVADLTAQFANLSKTIADLPGRIAAAQANAIQPADVAAAADAAAAQIVALPLPPAPAS